MKPSIKLGFVGVGVAIAATLTALILAAFSGRATAEGGLAAQVDMRPFDRIAVHTSGRFKSFDSFAHEHVGRIAGRGLVLGQPRDFTYLDMMFRPARYAAAPIIHVKKKPMRAELAQALEGLPGFTPAVIERFMDDGRLPRTAFGAPAVEAVLDRWSRDLIKTAKHANEIRAAARGSSRRALESMLRIIPPPGGGDKTAWLTPIEFLGAAEAGAPAIGAMDPELREALFNTFVELEQAWASPEPPETAGPRVTDALASLAEMLPRVNPDVYPSRSQLDWESQYFRFGSFTWIWLIYLVSAIFLLMAVAYKWEGARLIGLGVFGSAALLHTFALALRWYVSGRWPNSNMFEAVTTSVWFGVGLAVLFEVLARRSSLRNFFALTGAFASMAALMAANFIPQLDPNINNMMPVLHDIWLYIHTNVIIASYALIAMASVTGGLYIVRRVFGGPADYARVGGTGMLLEASEAEAATGANPADPAAPGAPTALRPRRSFGEVLDGATLVLMELSFVMLWAGIAMGAIWADHSWGRPWGWDPKEVFALNTFIVFVVLIHVRMKARDKGLWTAILAVIGCAVMMFNWIVINFVISGLHSYA